jgi:hypothetical protein
MLYYAAGANVISQEEALSWMAKAAEVGHVFANTWMARLMFRGQIPGGRIKAISLLWGAVCRLVVEVWNTEHNEDPFYRPLLRK